MSWNSQNNNGSRDPWGNKNDAPDIDEAIKDSKQFSVPSLEEALEAEVAEKWAR